MDSCHVCGTSKIDLARDSHADLLGKVKQWLLRTESTSHEGPWQRGRCFTAALTDEATEASSIGWERIVNASPGPFRAADGFVHEWLSRQINNKEFCARLSEALRRAKVFVNVDN